MAAILGSWWPFPGSSPFLGSWRPFQGSVWPFFVLDGHCWVPGGHFQVPGCRIYYLLFILFLIFFYLYFLTPSA